MDFSLHALGEFRNESADEMGVEQFENGGRRHDRIVGRQAQSDHGIRQAVAEDGDRNVRGNADALFACLAFCLAFPTFSNVGRVDRSTIATLALV